MNVSFNYIAKASKALGVTSYELFVVLSASEKTVDSWLDGLQRPPVSPPALLPCLVLRLLVEGKIYGRNR
jgi:hypothetical protein